MDAKSIRDSYGLLWAGPTARVTEIVYMDLLQYAEGEQDPSVRAGIYAAAARLFTMAHEEDSDAV